MCNRYNKGYTLSLLVAKLHGTFIHGMSLGYALWFCVVAIGVEIHLVEFIIDAIWIVLRPTQTRAKHYNDHYKQPPKRTIAPRVIHQRCFHH